MLPEDAVPVDAVSVTASTPSPARERPTHRGSGGSSGPAATLAAGAGPPSASSASSDSRLGRVTSFGALLTCLLGAFGLTCVMALISAPGAHPDEVNHAAAARYFTDHWLPPRTDAETLRPSMSPYGVSYLAELDFTYLFAGKTASLVPLDATRDHLRFRLFNVLLLAALVAVYALYRTAFSPIALLLLTPQTWYVFSYANNDALPLAASLLLVHVAVAPTDRAPAFVAPIGRGVTRAAICGALAGVLVLTKANYALFLAFVALLALWRIAGRVPALAAIAGVGVYLAQERAFLPITGELAATILAAGTLIALAALAVRARRDPEVRRSTAAVLIAAALAAGVAIPPIAYDVALNGAPAEKNAALSDLGKANAEIDRRPSPEGRVRAFGSRLRRDGVSIADMFRAPWSWPQNTWKSFTGYYGHMDISSPFAYYLGIALVYVWLAAFLARAWLAQLWRSELGPEDFALAVVACGFAALTLAISFYHSWVNDFQAQGRYVFPALAILSAPFARAAMRLDARGQRQLGAVFVTAFALGVFSFGYRGLRRIPTAL